MNIEDWDLYYKTHETEFRPTTTQMCYEPRVSPQGDVFCMNFCYPCEYQANQQRLSYTADHVEFAFQRELKYLEIFKDRSYAPEILDIIDKKIFIKWYKKTCNDSFYKDQNLNLNWYNDLENIILDQVKLGYLKATLYPHSHYYDDNENMRTIDFYATIERSDPYLSYKQLIGLVGLDTDRFIEAQENDMLNIETIFKSGLLNYSKWPKGLDEIYKKIYG
jgi:hypothetical protein